MILHQDQPDYAAFDGEFVMPYSFEAIRAFSPRQISDAYSRGGVIESDERVDFYRDETGEVQSRPRRISVRFAIDSNFERDRVRLERDQRDMFRFD
jgi:hypothetical protein